MYVLKDNIDMAGIYDVITRGTAEIYHQEDQNIFLKDLRSGAYMLSVNDPEKGIRWLQERENARYDLMELWQKECAEYCRERYHLDTIMECRQAVWVKDSIKPLASSAVHPFCISPYSPNLVFTRSSFDSTPTVENESGRSSKIAVPFTLR